ncbi:G-protein coupled receptor 83-like [Ruditapes philippinarum]|uniref:G-protein coupled receptor 83-like n=1 Tax=Ruditapes philippinarum TaxID=129788 RepID=UPI00295AEC18|nr:G-protein coupled receptor 83-like [Ruditapes philippinarum]
MPTPQTMPGSLAEFFLLAETNPKEFNPMSYIKPYTNGTNMTDIDIEEKIIGRSLALVIAYGVLAAVALFGNILVCHVIFSRRRMRTVTNIFIANLAVSDLLLIVLNVPFNIAKDLMREWLFGDALCRIMNMSLIMSCYASTLTLTVIALDRHRVLLYPLRPRIMKSGGMVVVSLIWLVSVCLALPFAIYSKPLKIDWLYTHFTRCMPNYPSPKIEQCLTIITIILQYFIPLTVIGVTYGRIVRRIWERTDLGAVTAYQHACRSKHKKKSIKMLMIVVIVFAICWMPLNLYHLLTDVHPDIEAFNYDTTAFFVCHWIALSSTCYNPFIYCWLNEAFRAEIRAVFRCCCPVDINIYPRDNKMDSLSQSDSMSLQIKPKSLFTSKRNSTMVENLNTSLHHNHTHSGCDCRSNFLTSSTWRNGNPATESVDLLEHERNQAACPHYKRYTK